MWLLQTGLTVNTRLKLSYTWSTEVFLDFEAQFFLLHVLKELHKSLPGVRQPLESGLQILRVQLSQCRPHWKPFLFQFGHAGGGEDTLKVKGRHYEMRIIITTTHYETNVLKILPS